jgi:hypothetical protein
MRETSKFIFNSLASALGTNQSLIAFSWSWFPDNNQDTTQPDECHAHLISMMGNSDNNGTMCNHKMSMHGTIQNLKMSMCLDDGSIRMMPRIKCLTDSYCHVIQCVSC